MVGVILFGNLLKYLFITFLEPTKILFLGLILGSIPALIKQTNSKNKFKFHYIFYGIITFAFSLFLIFTENNVSTYSFCNLFNNNFLYYIFSGFLMSAGVIIPGVSSTVILMLLGIYYTYIEAISIVNLTILFPMGIGLIIGCILFLIIIKKVMNRFYSQTFYGIIGFVLRFLFYTASF